MDFSWDEEQDEIYHKVLEFVRGKLDDRITDQARQRFFSREEWRLCAGAGVLGCCLPECYGGLGLDALLTARVFEAFGRGRTDLGLAFSAAAHLFACVVPILQQGDDAQKSYFLPRLANGEWIGANAITESEAGSDVFALQTSARRDADAYVLNGVKSYVTNGPIADVFVVYATIGRAFGYLGVTAFLVERTDPGLSVGAPIQNMGLNSSPISSIYLNDCRVPVTRRLGAEGQGGPLFRAAMQWERTGLFASYVGMMERQLERLLEFTKSRRQFRKPLAKNQAISHRLVDMKLRLEAARLLLYRACWRLARSNAADVDLDVSLAKLAISEAVIQSGLDSVHLHGGLGYITGEIERELRDAIPGTIFSGTSEMQRDIIARALGL